jgi:hypothetical protein
MVAPIEDVIPYSENCPCKVHKARRVHGNPTGRKLCERLRYKLAKEIAFGLKPFNQLGREYGLTTNNIILFSRTRKHLIEVARQRMQLDQDHDLDRILADSYADRGRRNGDRTFQHIVIGAPQ